MAGFFSLLPGSRASFRLFYSSPFESVLHRLKRQISFASLYLVDCCSRTFYPTNPYPCWNSRYASYIRILTFYFCFSIVVDLCGYFFSGITSCNLTSLRTLPLLFFSWNLRASALVIKCVQLSVPLFKSSCLDLMHYCLRCFIVQLGLLNVYLYKRNSHHPSIN